MTLRAALWSGGRQRTIWTWKLIAYPLVVIPVMVWQGFVAEQAPAVTAKGSVQYGDVSASATPIHGVTGGNAVTCYTHPKITLCYWMTKERG